MTKEQKKVPTTYERLMRNPEFKEGFEREWENLAVSEILIELMEKENLSVRALAKKAEVSASIIQELRSGKRKNPTMGVFTKLLHSMNATIEIRRKGKKLTTV